MLYFKALRDGLHAMPGADAQVRQVLDEQAARQGWPALHAELARVDPETAARLAPNDAQRIQRALEVWQLSGKALSAWHRLGAAHAPAAGTWPMVALEPQSRAWLHGRIASRLDQMLAEGLLQEVQALRARGDLQPTLPAMRCVGYRQAWQALEEGRLDGLREAAVAATRQLAKRQLTWLRSVPDRHVVAADAQNATAQAIQAMKQCAALA
jgi:tRNA dimethylallyltransferase